MSYRYRQSTLLIQFSQVIASVPQVFYIFTCFIHSERMVLKYPTMFMDLFFFKDFIYLFLDRGGGTETEKERNIMWLPLLRPWPTTQICALTGNQTGDPLVRRPVLSPLSHTSQGWTCCFLHVLCFMYFKPSL